jgi:signal transduction histidine kinase/ligand-binding sensor domain-containing protein/DNA-binding response OmpR family regulator
LIPGIQTNIGTRLLLFFTIISFYVYLGALSPHKAISQYKLDIWQAERGLAQNSVSAICQTRDGYIWLGTINGLVRFDGIRFKTFNKDNTAQLKDNAITSLWEDRKGILWIGTAEGGVSSLKDGEFKAYTLHECPGLKEISTIFEDREGTLWIGTLDSGLTRFKNGRFTTYTVKDGLAGNRVRAVHEDERGNLWFATSAGLTIRRPDGSFIPYTGTSGRFDKYIISMCRARNGTLWLGCIDGLYALKDKAIIHYGRKEGLPNLKIKCLYEDSRQNLWAGTDGGGLVRISNDRVETFSTSDGMACDYVYSICEDREGNLWIGTFIGGLHRLRDGAITPYTTREGLNNNIVKCIEEDQAGNLWIGTLDGVNRLKDGKLTLEFTTRQGLLSNIAYCIKEDSSGNLWIGTAAGLNLRHKDGSLKRFDTHSDFLNNEILQLLEDKSGVVWILTSKNLIHFHEGRFTVFLHGEELSNKPFQCFCKDREDSFWIGTYRGGLYRLKEGKRTHYTTGESLVHNIVEYIYEDKNGILYIGTRGGLSRLAEGKFINFTTRNGLIDSNVRHILEDDSGYLWLAGRTGISRINKKELSDFARGKIEKINPVLFDESDGLKSPWCEDGIKTRDGRLWFATYNGAAVIDPGNIKTNTLPPPVVIEEMIVDGEAVHIGSTGLHGRGEAPLVISPGKKRLEFYYTTLTFIKPQKVKFKLKLEGYDSDWLDAGNARSTTYTELAPGTYTFKVIACNADGVWNHNGASLSFYLKPYFYQTAWFYILVVFFILMAVFSFHLFRLRQLKTREKELGTLVEQRTRDLKERNIDLEKARQKIQQANELLEKQSEKLKEMDQIKSRFFANISHEFRTPLTLIMGPLEQVLTDHNTKDLEKNINLALRNSQRLLSLINQLLDLARLDSGKMQLQASRQNVIPFLKGLVGSFESLVVQKKQRLTFHAEQDDITLFYDPEKLEKVMVNLISNAVKFTPGQGEIAVSASGGQGALFEKTAPRTPAKTFDSTGRSRYSGGYLEIKVRDTGAGIPESQLPYIFDRFYQAEGVFTHEHKHKGSGIGLALVKELVELHHGDITVRSTEGKGTEFTLHLPLGSDHLKPEEIIDAGQIPARETRKIPLHEELDPLLQIEPDQDREIEDEKEDEKKNGSEDTGKDIILVVEDNPDVRAFIRGPLEHDYTVVEAADGREGIEKAREIIPDLIISDVMMPEADGYELCAVLKKDVKTSHIPIVLLTAKASDESIIAGLETGADDYITKPFNTRILLTRIKNLIDLRRQLQEKIQREMSLQPTEIAVSSVDRQFMQELKAAIEKNISDENFGVDELAGVLYMSRATLNRKIKALTGEATNQFIQSYRLKRAAQLLKANFGNVTEVAFEVGFSASAYFTRCFKEKFHRLPHTFQASEAGEQ